MSPSAHTKLGGIGSAGRTEVPLIGESTITYVGALLESLLEFCQKEGSIEHAPSSSQPTREEGKQYFEHAFVPERWTRAHHSQGGVILPYLDDVRYLSGEVKYELGDFGGEIFERNDLWRIPAGTTPTHHTAWDEAMSHVKSNRPWQGVNEFYIVHDRDNATAFHRRGGVTERADMPASVALSWATDALTKYSDGLKISKYDLTQKAPEWAVLDKTGMSELADGFIDLSLGC